jgi:hypothetical protein
MSEEKSEVARGLPIVNVWSWLGFPHIPAQLLWQGGKSPFGFQLFAFNFVAWRPFGRTTQQHTIRSTL